MFHQHSNRDETRDKELWSWSLACAFGLCETGFAQATVAWLTSHTRWQLVSQRPLIDAEKLLHRAARASTLPCYLRAARKGYGQNGLCRAGHTLDVSGHRHRVFDLRTPHPLGVACGSTRPLGYLGVQHQYVGRHERGVVGTCTDCSSADRRPLRLAVRRITPVGFQNPSFALPQHFFHETLPPLPSSLSD